MEHRVRIIEIDGQKVLGTVEKHCGPMCPCEKPREKGITNLATLRLAHFDPQCHLQRIPGLIEGLLLPQIHNRLDVGSDIDFEAYCKAQQQIHLTKVDEHIRFLANPGNRFSHEMLVNKLWNEQAVIVYSQALAANAIDGNAMVLPSVTAREPQLKNLSDTLRGAFTIEQLEELVNNLIPNLEAARSNDKQGQAGQSVKWKSAFPAIALALMQRGYMAKDVSCNSLAHLFCKHFKVSITGRTFQNRMQPDQTGTGRDYFTQAMTWLDKVQP
jgi:hypothetical protein